MPTPTTIELGLLAPSLSQQLNGVVLTGTLTLLELDNNAINRLLVRGYLSQSTAEVARKRLIRKIQSEAQKSARHFNGSNS